jgi:hypothetical protein
MLNRMCGFCNVTGLHVSGFSCTKGWVLLTSVVRTQDEGGDGGSRLCGLIRDRVNGITITNVVIKRQIRGELQLGG